MIALGALVLTSGAAIIFSLADARSRGLLVNTVKLAAGTLLIAVPAGGFLGLVLARIDVVGKRAATILLGGLLLVPLYLQAAAWQAGFGIEGWQTTSQTTGYRAAWLDGWRGAIWVHGCAGIPWVALFVGVAARSIPRTWEESALLDLSVAGVLRHVTLRHVLPAMMLGALWVVITTMTEMSVTDLFAVRTYVEELYIELNAGSWNVALDAAPIDESGVPALPGILLSLVAAAGALVVGRSLLVAPARESSGPPLVLSLGRFRGPLSVVMWLAVGMVVLLPFGSLIYKAGSFVTATEGGFARGWSIWKAVAMTIESPRDHAAELQWSLARSACAAFLTLLIAVPLADASRTSKLAGGVALLLAVTSLAVPGPLVGLGLIATFNDPAWPWLNYLYDHTIVVTVLAQSLRAFPLTFFLIWQALRTVPLTLIEAAVVDGAGPLRRVWLAVRQRPAAVALAALAAAVISLGELAATILVVPPGIEPLSVRVFGLLHYNVEDQVAAISLFLVLLHSAAACVLLAASRRVFRLG